ncbi:MAG: hypothetical protein ACJZ9B_03015 [Coraliomargaritaceae bacterium]
MFLKFLLESRCSICHKLDRSQLNTNPVAKDNFFSELICTCREFQGFYFSSKKLFRIIQTIVLVVLFTATVSTLFLVRNSFFLNTEISAIVSGYADSQKGLKEINSQKVQEQFAKQIIYLDRDSK